MHFLSLKVTVEHIFKLLLETQTHTQFLTLLSCLTALNKLDSLVQLWLCFGLHQLLKK